MPRPVVRYALNVEGVGVEPAGVARSRLRVNEIFHSIQGEGTRAGRRCVFVRLTGCHLRCTYCDTEYAFYEGSWRTLDDILAEVQMFDCDFVEVTGGEPLLQPAVYSLMDRLLGLAKTVAVETSGAINIGKVNPQVVRIVDFKTPTSGEVERNCWDNVALLTNRDEVKFVIGSREDYEWSREVVRQHELTARCAVLFSPVIGPDGGRGQDRLPQAAYSLYRGGLAPQSLAEWMLADRLDVRLGLQLHKFVWSPTARGV